jgi:hypothetical protein
MQCLEDPRLDTHQGIERVLHQALRVERLRVVASSDTLPNRDAISPVKRLTTSLANSAVISASVQDATMHAPFAPAVQSNVRETRRNPR